MTEEKKTNRLQQLIADFRDNRDVLAELLTYVKPYRVRFGVGILCGAGFNFINGTIMLLIWFVGNAVFANTGDADLASKIPNFGPLKWFKHHIAINLLGLDHVSRKEGLIAACIIIPAVMMIRSVFDYLNNYLSIWIGNKVLIDIRSRVMEHVTSQSLDYFNEMRAGTLIQKVFNETLAMQGVFLMLSQQINQPIAIFTGIACLLKINWLFTVGALVLLPCVIAPVLALGKKIRRAATMEQAERGEMMVILHEMIAGIKVIKSFARTQHEVNRFNASSQTQFRQIMRVQRTIETIAPVVESLAGVGVTLGLVYAYQVHMDGSTLLTLCTGIFMLYQPAKGLSKTHLNLVRSLAVTRSVFELLRREPTVKDAPDAKVLTDCQGEIVFDNVSFGYRKDSDGRDILAVENINLRFEKGKYYALVGLSGSGKSTMLSLMLRFYDPLRGSIRIDGQDLRSLTQDSLHQQIGIVTQENFLFHETIFKNIIYGKLDASKEEVELAAKLAYAHDFIVAQQKGYETLIGDRGSQLSGGQQQRISIARALLKDAPVLLLDEAMSALDSEAEMQIQSALDELIKGRTTISIAHRLSTILKADMIVVMDAGRIVETGTCAELLAKGGHFKRLYDLQFERHDNGEGQPG